MALPENPISTTSGGAPLAPILLSPLAAGKPTNTPTPTRTPPLGVARTITYTYVAVGNRLTQNNNGTVTIYTYDLANRLTNVNGQAYTWDNNGNLLSDGTRTFTYDTANRLTQVVSASTTTQMVYNGLSDRLSLTINDTQTRYVNDPAAGLTQVLADGTNTYLYGLGRLAQQQTNMQYFGADGLGCVRQLYTSTGQIIFHNPGIKPAVFEVKFPAGPSLTIDPPSGYFNSTLPFISDVNILEAPSLRSSGAFNYLIRSDR